MFPVGQRIYFSEWLQVEMNKRGWSQSDLARQADLNRAVINKLLNGKSHPQPATLEAISRALKMPLETTYRAAGLLPANSDHDDAAEEAMHIFKSILRQRRYRLSSPEGTELGEEEIYFSPYDCTIASLPYSLMMK